MLLVAVASGWLCATLPVFSQEAYYWTYAQHPALSYFDHPPMVAWLIWLGTQVFGDGSIGIRFGTWACGLGATVFGALLAREFGLGRAGESLWILLSFVSPILTMTHCIANPDAPLVCSWTLVMLAMWKARDGSLGWWLIAGIAAGTALLSKYSAAFLAISGLLLLACDPKMRRQLRHPGPWLAVLLASVVFLPVVIWNMRNDFESFRFQTEDRFAKGTLGLRWLGQFVGEQLLIVHPALAIGIVLSLVWLLRRVRLDPRFLWLLAFGLPLPAWFLANSLFIQVKINWLAPAVVPLLLGVVAWWSERERGRPQPSLRLARAAAWTLAAVPLAIPFAPALCLVPAGRGTSWVGWNEIAARAEHWEDQIDPADGIEGNCFYFAADYRDAAQLGRNLFLLRHATSTSAPLQADIDFEPTMAQNVFGMRGLQYDHWNPPAQRIGQDAIFVLPRPHQREGMVDKARQRFDRVEKVDRVEIRRLGVYIVDADIYVCRGYKGPDAGS